jgi:2-polyprenyl-6-methoxyphenol hydroxylase-like FAD-dependent oxidoreductase
MAEPDFVIVGGGIAGGALATVMARAGASVLVLERQPRYQDHVRGEILWSWGVQVAGRLGIEQTLLDAGALVVRWLDTYDEGTLNPDRTDVGAVFSTIKGSLNLSHPAACAALADAAVLAGADVRMGVRQVDVTPGERPLIRWAANNGEEQQARAKVVIGADGRRSSVRAPLLDEPGVGPIVAAQLIVAWSHSGRVRSEAASRDSPAPHRSPPRADRQHGIDSAAAATAS